MSREIFLVSALICASCVALWAAIDFKKTQERAFHQALENRSFLHKKNQFLKEDLAFVESHQKDIDFFNEKGWFSQKNRLIAAEFLESLRPLLKEVSYQLSPETIKEMKDTISFKVTQISFETKSLFDVEVYAFLNALLTQFPGVLILRSFTLRRQEGESNYIQGTGVVDWVAMNGEK